MQTSLQTIKFTFMKQLLSVLAFFGAIIIFNLIQWNILNF